jgi:hypothetical protein
MKNIQKCKPTVLLLGLLIASNLLAQKIDFKILKFGQNSNHTIADNLIISTRSDLKNLEIELSDSVDFGKELLIAIFRGGCPSGGYGVHINAITRKKDNLMVEVIYTDPGENCKRTLSLTQPFAIYRIKKTDASISFNESTIVKDCESK